MIFKIPGPIKGKARARTFYDPKAGKHRSVTPKDTVIYENWVKTCYIKERERYGVEYAPLMKDEPIDMWITVYFDVPKSTTKANKIEIKEGRLLPTKKPDADNIAKSICDALNGVAYADDKQIVCLTVQKRYTEPGQEPFTLVAIEKHRQRKTIVTSAEA